MDKSISLSLGLEMLNKIKEKLDKPLNTSARLLHQIGFTPTVASLLGLLSGLVSGAAYYGTKQSSGMIYVALAFLIFSGFLDAVDGAMARLYGHVTSFGGVLDSVTDRIEEAAILTGIVAAGLVSAPIGLSALAGSLMVSYVRARVESEGTSMSGVGFGERPERLIVLACATAVGLVDVGVTIVAVLAWITVAQRMIYAQKQLR
jgi:archaetidylinositol phosphate synthase